MNISYKNSLQSSPANFQNFIDSIIGNENEYRNQKTYKKIIRHVINEERGVNKKIFNIECSNKNLITALRFEAQRRETNEETPMIIFFYGNSWSNSKPIHFDNFCSHLCSITNSVVLNINLSLAPFSKFPNAAIESYDAIKWAWQACSFWKINREKIYIFAEGCGANNALNAVMKIRDNGDDIKIAGIILSDPLLDCRLTHKSFTANSITPTLKTSDISHYISQYISDRTQIFDQNLSLVLKKDWTRLSTILLLSSISSPLYDDSLFLYHKIIESEGNVIFYPTEKTYNGFLYTKKYPEKHKIENIITTFIANNDPGYMKLLFEN